MMRSCRDPAVDCMQDTGACEEGNLRALDMMLGMHCMLEPCNAWLRTHIALVPQRDACLDWLTNDRQ